MGTLEHLLAAVGVYTIGRWGTQFLLWFYRVLVLEPRSDKRWSE